MTSLINTFKVKLKSLRILKPFARHAGGDMSETMSYFIKFNGDLIKSDKDLNEQGSFHAVYKHVMENGEEFLVVDHPNIITKREYEMSKELYDKVEVLETERSMKGVC